MARQAGKPPVPPPKEPEVTAKATKPRKPRAPIPPPTAFVHAPPAQATALQQDPAVLSLLTEVFILITDLHVGAKTVDRVVEVLRRARALALRYRATIVCLGDFWDRRGILAIRQLDPILEEFDLWRMQNVRAVIIPGNHDQVSVNGKVHGVRVFDAYGNIQVATEPIVWPVEKVMFLPWREDAAEQNALFQAADTGWTVFAHAEVQGAITNQHHAAPGRVTTAQIESFARACYVGHYHKRQKLGACTWYIGSPFEQNMGERDEPHGCAVVRLGTPEPEWIDWTDFPRHYRYTLAAVQATPLEHVRPHDVVEVEWPRNTSPADLAEAMARIPAADVRSKPVSLPEEQSAPAFAFTIDSALVAYLADRDLAEPLRENYLSFARAVLAQIPGSKGLTPLSTFVRPLSVQVTDFGAIRGTVNLDLTQQGLMLIRGEQGLGKTALVDAITWCLYGVTTPRKAGSETAVLRADEIVNDDADFASVQLPLQLGDGRQVRITRTKQRGKGAKVVIVGVDQPDGIDTADQQMLIDRIVGLPLELWRACVSLGQGSVANFLTGADKRRKELFSTAFGLDACPKAREAVKEYAKGVAARAEQLRASVISCDRLLGVLASQDFRQQIADFSTQQMQSVALARQQQADASTAIATADAALAGEGQWLTSKAQYDAHLASLLAQVTQTTNLQLAELQMQLGALRSERATIDRDAHAARSKHQQAQHAQALGTVPCPTCQRAFDTSAADQHVLGLDQAVRTIETDRATSDVKISNVMQQIEQYKHDEGIKQATARGQIEETQAALHKINAALSQFATLKGNRDNQLQRLREAEASEQRLVQQQNPWLAKQEENEARRRTTQDEKERAEVELSTLDADVLRTAFWTEAFGPKGLPVLVLRTAIYDLEAQATRFLTELTRGKISCRVELAGDDLDIVFSEYNAQTRKTHERRYEQLSGGERRCAELAFSPFALSELIFSRCGVRLPLMAVDELTTHLGPDAKMQACSILRALNRETVIVIDHDLLVQGEFDRVFELQQVEGQTTLVRAP